MTTAGRNAGADVLGYPSAFERTVRLRDGRQVLVRPILPTDAAALTAAIRSADTETLHLRFLGAPPPLTGSVLDSLTRLDYVNRFAVVAFADSGGVGIGRYIALPPVEGCPRTAEVAVVADPAWRRVGLGTALIRLLAERAADCGIDEFSAVYLARNRPVSEIASGVHAEVVIAEGVAELRGRLPVRNPAVPQSSDRA